MQKDCIHRARRKVRQLRVWSLYVVFLLRYRFYNLIFDNNVFICTLRFHDNEVREIIYRVTVKNQHHERCAEMRDQQILSPPVKTWFQGLMAGGLSATQALCVYEEAVVGGTQAFQSELLTQVRCLFLNVLCMRAVRKE